jgi:hypothetical protein
MGDFRDPACAHPSSSGDLNESPDIASKKIEVVVDQLDARNVFGRHDRGLAQRFRIS